MSKEGGGVREVQNFFLFLIAKGLFDINSR